MLNKHIYVWNSSKNKAQVQNQGHVTSTFICAFKRNKQ